MAYTICLAIIVLDQVVNDALPSDIVSSDQLDDVMSMFGEHDIKTGVVIDITGSLTKARVQKFPSKSQSENVRIEVVEIDGPIEVTGHGMIGMTEGSGGIGEYKLNLWVTFASNRKHALRKISCDYLDPRQREGNRRSACACG